MFINKISYRVNYFNKESLEMENASCFSKIYNYIDKSEMRSIEIFYEHDFINIHRNDKAFQNTNEHCCSEEEVLEYLNLLKEIGFKLSYELDSNFNGIPCSCFTIPVNENSVVSTKILLNLYRYCYESVMPAIVRGFLKLAKDNSEECNLFSKLIIAHCAPKQRYNAGHCILKHDYLAKLMDDDYFEKMVLNNNITGSYICQSIIQYSDHVSSPLNMYSKNRLSENFDTNTASEIIKIYKNL